jgi:multiple sugar transport system substrate-binding protein
MKTSALRVVLCLWVVALAGCGERDRPRLTALFVTQSGYAEQDIRDLTKAFELEDKEFDVRPFFVTYESLHDSVLASAASRAQGYDIVELADVWTAELVESNVLLDLTDRVKAEPVNDLVPFALENFTLKGRHYAMPWLVDCECLFYNRDLLKRAGLTSPPRTWAELAAQAKTIKEKGIVEFPIAAHWGHQEGLVCDFACLLLGRGGRLFDEQGAPAFTKPPGLESLGLMKRLLDEGLVNPASVESTSGDAAHLLTEGSLQPQLAVRAWPCR